MGHRPSRLTWMPFAIATLVGCADAEPGDLPWTGAATFEVAHYDVALELATRRATVLARLRLTSDGDCVSLPFRSGAPELVGLGDAAGDPPAARVALADGFLRACDGAGLGWPSGSTVVLSSTHVIPEGTWDLSDVGWSSNVDQGGGTFEYLLSWLGGCDLHGPCDTRTDRFATFRFRVTHGAATEVLCPGRLTTASGVTTCDFDFPGGPTYSTYALMSRTPAWTKSALGTWRGVEVSLHDFPDTQIAGSPGWDAAAAGFAWLIDNLGAYPYGNELRFVVGSTWWAGFEHPGNIVLAEDLAADGTSHVDGLTHVVIHELVHQWAGDQATLADTYDFVWKEAMAEYLSHVIEDELMGAAAAEEDRAAWKDWSLGAAHHPVPGERPPLFDFYGDVYGPGPMVLFLQLETWFGRAAMVQSIVSLVGTGRPRTLSIDDVQAALEVASGTDLTPYFDAWVHGIGAPTWPEATVDFGPTPGGGAGDYTVNVTAASADGKARGCAFHVRLSDESGNGAEVLVDNGPGAGAYPPAHATGLTFAPTVATLDPRSECLIYPAAVAMRSSGSSAHPRPRLRAR